MEATKTLTSRSGNEQIALSASTSSSHVRLHHQHVDEFDGDEDYWVTLGEFRVQELLDALLPPVTATLHVANTKSPTTKRSFWRRK